MKPGPIPTRAQLVEAVEATETEKAMARERLVLVGLQRLSSVHGLVQVDPLLAELSLVAMVSGNLPTPGRLSGRQD